MLLEFAIGDAYGRTFEFQSREFTKENNNVEGYKHREGEEDTGIGIYTDDTQMALAIAEAMLSGVPVTTQVRYASHFMEAYHRDPRGGYSKRIKKALEDSNPKFPFEFLLRSNPPGFKSNGSVMRTLPLGLYDDPNKIIHECMVHTSCSHGSMEAFHGTVAVSLTAHYFYHVKQDNGDDPIAQIMKYHRWMKEKMGPVYDMVMDSDANYNELLPCDGMRSAAASIRMAWENDDPNIILWRSIERGGDVDTLAAVSLGLWKLKTLNDKNAKRLKPVFTEFLENDKYGRDYLKSIDEKLYAKFPRKTENLQDAIV